MRFFFCFMFNRAHTRETVPGARMRVCVCVCVKEIMDKRITNRLACSLDIVLQLRACKDDDGSGYSTHTATDFYVSDLKIKTDQMRTSLPLQSAHPFCPTHTRTLNAPAIHGTDAQTLHMGQRGMCIWIASLPQ